jgi:hypothetical protein
MPSAHVLQALLVDMHNDCRRHERTREELSSKRAWEESKAGCWAFAIERAADISLKELLRNSFQRSNNILWVGPCIPLNES